MSDSINKHMNKAVERILASIDKNTKKYLEEIKKANTNDKSEARGLSRQITKQKQEHSASKELTQQHEKLAKALAKYRKKLDEGQIKSSQDVDKYHKKISNAYKEISKSSQVSKSLSDMYNAVVAVENQYKSNRVSIDRLENTVISMDSALQQELSTLHDTVKEQKLNVKRLKALNNISTEFTKRITQTTSEFLTLSASVGLITEALHAFTSEAIKARKTQSAVLNTWSSGFQAAFNFGMTAEELQDVYAKHRVTLLSANKQFSDINSAMGSTTQYLDSMKHDLADTIGEIKDVPAYALSIFDAIKNAGSVMSLEDFSSTVGSLDKRLKHLSTMTGQSADQIVEQVNSYIQDSDTRELLRQMTEKQRRAFMANTLAVMENQVAQGKLTDESLRAQKAMAAIAGMNPKDRLKGAAKLSAMMGAFGVQGGNEMMKLLLKPKAMWSQQESEWARQKFDQLERKRAAGLGSSNIGTQIFTATMWEQQASQIQQMITENSTILNEGKALNANIEKHIGIIEQLVGDVREYSSQISSFLKDSGAVGFLGVAAGSLALLKSASLLRLTPSKLKNVIRDAIVSAEKIMPSRNGNRSNRKGRKGGVAGKLAGAGLLAGELGALPATLIATGAASIAELINSGGQQSTIHDMLPESFSEWIGASIASVFDPATTKQMEQSQKLLDMQNEADDRRHKELMQEQREIRQQLTKQNEVAEQQLKQQKEISTNSKKTVETLNNTNDNKNARVVLIRARNSLRPSTQGI